METMQTRKLHQFAVVHYLLCFQMEFIQVSFYSCRCARIQSNVFGFSWYRLRIILVYCGTTLTGQPGLSPNEIGKQEK